MRYKSTLLPMGQCPHLEVHSSKSSCGPWDPLVMSPYPMVWNNTGVMEENVNKDFQTFYKVWHERLVCISALIDSVFISLNGLTTDIHIMLFCCWSLYCNCSVFRVFVLICHQSHLIHLDGNLGADPQRHTAADIHLWRKLSSAQIYECIFI